MIATILILILVYLLALRGRTGHPLLPELAKWKYAHRGLHGDGVPENSMAGFRDALENGYGIELDIHLLADGNLAVIHDASLLRTAGADVMIEDLSADDLGKYRLESTNETIPLFSQVLDLFDGKAPLIVELKPANGNHDALAAQACDMLKDYRGLYCVESFDPRCIRWLMKNRPEIVRGQLAHNSLGEHGNVPFILRFIMTNLLSNFWNRPDFIAYEHVGAGRLPMTLVCGLMGCHAVTWTVRTKEELEAARPHFDTLICENIPVLFPNGEKCFR